MKMLIWPVTLYLLVLEGIKIDKVTAFWISKIKNNLFLVSFIEVIQ